MAANRKSNVAPVVYIAAIAVLVVLILVRVLQPAVVESIEIAYSQDARSYCNQNNIGDDTIMRTVGLNQRSMSEFDSFREECEARIGHLYGYLFVQDVEKTDRTSIKITLGARKPVALIISGQNSVLVDEEGTILQKTSKTDDQSIIKINGFVVESATLNIKAEAKAVDGTTIQDALKVAKVLRDSGYYSWFTDITVIDNSRIRLSTSKKVPVIIYLRFDVLKSLDIAYGILKDGVSEGGTITVTGDNGYYNPDDKAAVTTSGM